LPVATAPFPALAALAPSGNGEMMGEPTHHSRAAEITSWGIRIPASWQARSPRAATCELELSPAAMPSRLFLTCMNRTTLGFFVSAVAAGAFGCFFALVATSLLTTSVETGSGGGTAGVGVPYDHWPFLHWLSIRNWAHWAIRAWYFTRFNSSSMIAWSATL